MSTRSIFGGGASPSGAHSDPRGEAQRSRRASSVGRTAVSLVLAAVTATALATATASAQSPGSPFPPQPTAPPTVPAPPPPLFPNAAYDLAKGPSSPTNSGQGGWLPVISNAACPANAVSVPPVAASPVPPPARTGGGGGARKKTTAKAAPTTAAAAPASTVAAAATADGAPRATNVGLKAGSVDDNEKWTDYLLYRRKYLTSGLFAHDLDVGQRQVLRVVDDAGKPVLGARIDISDAGNHPVVDLRTFADGRAVFFPRLTSNPGSALWNYRVSGTNGATVTGTFGADVAGQQITLPGGQTAARGAVKLDVEFLIDTTGSMGDEIDQLRANMVQVSQQIAALPTRPDVRFSMSVYRDCGDEFVSRTYDFDANVGRFISELGTVRADGGGDEPEALNQALYDAVSRPGWRGDDAVKIIFLVADAPPHLDYAGDVDYALQALRASKKGIKIQPIASSGSNDQAEYVFRQLAQLTTGRMVFLTYGADGASPGDRTKLNVDSYEVLSLDQLVVRLVAEELAYQGPEGRALSALPTGPSVGDGPIVPGAPPPVVSPPVVAPPVVVVPPPPVRFCRIGKSRKYRPCPEPLAR